MAKTGPHFEIEQTVPVIAPLATAFKVKPLRCQLSRRIQTCLFHHPKIDATHAYYHVTQSRSAPGLTSANICPLNSTAFQEGAVLAEGP